MMWLVILDKNIEIDLVDWTRKYKSLIKKGKKILNILEHGDNILEAALDIEDKKAIEYYRGSIKIDPYNICLRPWQNDLMKYLDNSDDRQ